jgi:hypothetical protein
MASTEVLHRAERNLPLDRSLIHIHCTQRPPRRRSTREGLMLLGGTTSAATFGIYLQKICLFPERGDLIFARHGTVLASKAKRDAPTEAVGVCCLWDEKANSES